jgi:hypothetical protein
MLLNIQKSTIRIRLVEVCIDDLGNSNNVEGSSISLCLATTGRTVMVPLTNGAQPSGDGNG